MQMINVMRVAVAGVVCSFAACGLEPVAESDAGTGGGFVASGGGSNAGGGDGSTGGGDATPGGGDGSTGGGDATLGGGDGSVGGGDAATGGGSTTSGGGTGVTGGGAATTGGGTGTVDAGLPHFSFFVTSYAALWSLSGTANGFGGDLRYGETGMGAGLRGADKICTTIAETSMPGSGMKVWRAFLSADQGEDGGVVNAIDRVGEGPWYDRLGRVLALTKTGLISTRPTGCNTTICNDFPNEDGVLNHRPDGTTAVDNHDMLTGTNSAGQRYTSGSSSFNCLSWTTSSTQTSTTGKPRVGHSWPAMSGQNWMNALTEAGCGAGVNLQETGGPTNNGTVGSGGGYGGFYCFALTP